MNWKTISTSLGTNAFGLWNNGEKMLTLAYKSQSNTLYLESEDGDKRQFHYRKKGIFKNKIVLQNEYGADLGALKKEGDTEFVEVADKRYFLKYKNNNSIVEIMDEAFDEPVATCNFEVESTNDSLNNSLLMVACLYIKKMYSPVGLATV